MAYTIRAFAGHSQERDEDAVEKFEVEDFETAKEQAKALLFKQINPDIDWATDTWACFIDRVEIRDTRYDFNNPETLHYQWANFSIWDDEFSQHIRLEHVHELHHVLFQNYYEDGRNEPLVHALYCGGNHQILDVYWMHISSRFGHSEDYVVISALPENYEWENGWQDWDETNAHIYSAQDVELRKLLKAIRKRIA